MLRSASEKGAGRQRHPNVQETADGFFTLQSLEELQQSWTRALEVSSHQSRGQQNRKNQGCSVSGANHFTMRKGRDRTKLHVSAHQSLSY